MAAIEIRLIDRIAAVQKDLGGRIAAVQKDLGDRVAAIGQDVGSLRGELHGLAAEFREFRGLTKGAVVGLVTLLPLATALAVTALNYWLLHPGGPLR